MRLRRLITILALAAGTVGFAPAVAAPMASAFGDSPGVSAPDNGSTHAARPGRGWR